MKYKNILFDLDGVITDSGEGIMKSVKHALDYFSIEIKDEVELRRFVGPPLKDSFAKFYNFSEEETKLAIEKFREYFTVKGMYENKVYEGIDELLEELTKTGKKVFVVTSKPEKFSIQILEYFDLAKYFTGISASTMDLSKSKKAELIKDALENYKLKLEETVMIGDRAEDIIGANENNADSIGVLYGYGDYEELYKVQSTHIVKDVIELRELLI
ncbi:MAG: HAD-IA family hydrolase [Oscillospiraceae bacterium]|nr:HAD-IA family hydrolase [Oscillospiraceae bacterium]